MTTVALTASTGMLGSMAYRIMAERFDLVLLYRDEGKLRALDDTYGGVDRHRTVRVDYADLYRGQLAASREPLNRLVAEIGEVDAVVNCAGVIIPHTLDSPETTFFVNGALPHLLSHRYGARLIHVTTDCVFSGESGAPYDEHAPASPRDLYGLSKAMGEPAARSLVLRTSIIGPELGGAVSLLEWLRSQAGRPVDGFVNHLWNGLTTSQLARSIARIIEERADFPATGLFHLFSTAVSKYELLRALDERYAMGVQVRPTHVRGVDRRLATVRTLNADLRIPALDAMLAEIPDARRPRARRGPAERPVGTPSATSR